MALHRSTRFILFCFLLAARFAEGQAQEFVTPRAASRSEVADALRKADYASAARLLEVRAKASDGEAQYQLGSLYRTGRGVVQDDVLAYQWTLRAAETGHVKAMVSVARMLAAGRGVNRDAASAREWLQKAKASGNAEAADLLATLATGKLEPTSRSGGWDTVVNADGGNPSIQTALPERLTPGRADDGLFDAAWRGKAKLVEELLGRGADPRAHNASGSTPLTLAAEAGHAHIVTLLLTAHADANATTPRAETPMYLAASRGHAQVVELLLRAGARPNLRTYTGETPLSMALRGCHIAVATSLLRLASPEPSELPGAQTLAMLSAANCPQTLGLVLARDRKHIDSQDEEGRTALWHAADRGRVEAVAELVAKGAKTSISDNVGRTPLLRALEIGETAAALPLIAAEKQLDRTTADGNTALLIAAKTGQVSAVERLTKAGAAVNFRNAEGFTALMVASSEGHAEVVRHLLTAGADRYLRNKRRQSAPDIAKAAGHSDIEALLH